VGATAKARGIPCLAVAGSVGQDMGDLHATGIDAVFSLCTGPTTLADAMQNAGENLARVTQQALRAFLAGRNRR
jgi:glycerate kinase